MSSGTSAFARVCGRYTSLTASDIFPRAFTVSRGRSLPSSGEPPGLPCEPWYPEGPGCGEPSPLEYVGVEGTDTSGVSGSCRARGIRGTSPNALFPAPLVFFTWPSSPFWVLVCSLVAAPLAGLGGAGTASAPAFLQVWVVSHGCVLACPQANNSLRSTTSSSPSSSGNMYLRVQLT